MSSSWRFRVNLLFYVFRCQRFLCWSGAPNCYRCVWCTKLGPRKIVGWRWKNSNWFEDWLLQITVTLEMTDRETIRNIYSSDCWALSEYHHTPHCRPVVRLDSGQIDATQSCQFCPLHTTTHRRNIFWLNHSTMKQNVPLPARLGRLNTLLISKNTRY